MKLDVISGFLGAGKTTFLNKILPELNERVVVIENEYGDVSVDGSLLDEELPVKEIMAGCICCSLVLDFKKAIVELAAKYQPDRIIIEPSGVSCLSDVLRACQNVKDEVAGGLEIDRLITIVDASAFNDYIEGFGVFYGNQIANANLLFLSHLQGVTDVPNVVAGLKAINDKAYIWQEDWFQQDGALLASWLQTMSAQQLSQPELDNKRVIFNADDVFGSWSTDSQKTWQNTEVQRLLAELGSGNYGRVLRAKGILRTAEGKMINFNFTPYHQEQHLIDSRSDAKVAVIGCKLEADKLAALFA